MILSGKTISPGVAHGVARVVDTRVLLATAMQSTTDKTPAVEIERLRAAIGLAAAQLDRVQRQLRGQLQASNVAIFASHIRLVRDPKFIERVEHAITEQARSAEAAVAHIVSDLHQVFMSQPVPLLKDKAADILDIGARLLRCLTSEIVAGDVRDGDVIIAQDLTPSELVRFSRQGLAAVVTETCGSKSHTAILARGLRIPLLTGIAGACDVIPNGQPIVVDGDRSRIIVAESDTERRLAESLIGTGRQSPRDSAPVTGPAMTQDGQTIPLLLNISDPSEAAAVPEIRADGVGLFRTEFFYMDRPGWPSEEESFAVYQRVAAALGETELHVRLVDFGAEKCPDYSDIPLNRNPSLGLRGIRLLLQREDIFRPQVRAVARIAAQRPVTLLIPMIGSIDTLLRTTDKLCEFCQVRTREELPFRLGAMIEVPAAALVVRQMARHVDSIAIGLNDLTQYTLAADRDDENVEKYHDARQPGVLYLVRQIVDAGRVANIPVSICGELAGDPSLTAILLILGVRRFSVSRSNFPGMITLLKHLNLSRLAQWTDELLALDTAERVRQFVADKVPM